MKERALCEITNPYRMLQAIWLTQEFPMYDWDIVIRYVNGNAESVNQIAHYCKKSGCFRNVFEVYTSGIDGKFRTKIVLFFKLFCYLVTFRKHDFFVNTIKEITNYTDYNLYCAENSLSFLGASMMNLADEKTVYVLEDGICEYTGYVKRPFGITYMIGCILYHLGIVNFISKGFFSRNIHCIKYVYNPDLIWEKNFKEIRKLFDNQDSVEKYKNIISGLFDLDLIGYDAVVFTDLSKSLVPDMDKCIFLDWIERNYFGKKVLFKLHPRDLYIYKSDKLDIDMKYSTVPGEVVMDFLTYTDVIFMGASALLMRVRNEKKVTVMHFSSLKMESDYHFIFQNAMDVCKDKQISVVDI